MEHIPDIYQDTSEKEPVILTSQDRVWMEGQLGCQWPDESDEQQWLQEVNELVVLGSAKLTPKHSIADHPYVESVKQARISFLELMPAINMHLLDVTYSDNPEWLKPKSVIDNVRMYLDIGLDGRAIAEKSPQSLTRLIPSLRHWISVVGMEGLDPIGLINRKPSLANAAPETIIARLQPMYAIARAAGLADYRKSVHNYINDVDLMAVLINHNPDIIRTISQIFVNLGIDKPHLTKLSRVFIYGINSNIVTYLERQSNSSNFDDYAYMVGYNFRNRDPKELKSIIAAHATSDDLVIKKYLKGYPIDDPEAAQVVWARHVRSRERRKVKEYPLLWSGPALLGDPAASSLDSYANLIKSPLIGEDMYQQLASMASAGQRAGQELRDLNIRHDDEAVRILMETERQGELARNALIARHLGIAAEIARDNLGDKQELVGIGNVAISKYVIKEFDPVENAGDAIEFERSIIASVMRAMVGYGPRFRGYGLRDLEKFWQDSREGPAPLPSIAVCMPKHASRYGSIEIGLAKSDTPDIPRGSIIFRKKGQADDKPVVVDKEAFAELQAFIKAGSLDHLVR